MYDSDIVRWACPSVILVATDLSDIDRLRNFSIRQARETGARLILFHVVSTDDIFPVEAMGFPCYDLSGTAECARRRLQPWSQQARNENIRCDVLVREGHPAVQILEAVRQFKVDRLILCTRGRGRFSKLLLGSVAEQVLRSVTIPVITVGPEAHPEVTRDARNRVVLLATTLQETSRTSAALACSIAAHLQATLLLVHVVPGAETRTVSQSRANNDINVLRELHQIASSFCPPTKGPPTTIEVQVKHGNPGEEILNAAIAHQADLIMLGCSRQFTLHNLTHDRTIYRVLANAHCPVLTLHETVASEQVTLHPELLAT